MSSSGPRVAAIVLNWNRTSDTVACVKSLRASDWPHLTTIVVDNGSVEPVADAVRAAAPEAQLVRSGKNLGFGGGMNLGIERAFELGADWLLLLNNDAIAESTMVSRLVQAGVSHADAGILSPLVLDRDAPGVIASAGAVFDPRRGHPGRSASAGRAVTADLRGVREVAASSGEAMLVASTTVRAVGGLDASLFLRLEDIDWSLRMRTAGRRNYVVLDAHLWHAVSASTGGEHSPLNAYYHTRNILFVCGRHAPMPRLRSALREAEVLLANAVHARRGEHPSANLRAALAGWRDYRRGRMGER